MKPKIKKATSKPKKTAKKTAKKRLFGGSPTLVDALELPEGFNLQKATPEQMQKLVAAVTGLYHQGVAECSEAIYNVIMNYPVPIALGALEMGLIATVGHLGDVEQKALTAHLAQFHAELTLMSAPEPTATVH